MTAMTNKDLSLKDNCYGGKELEEDSAVDKELLLMLSSPINELVGEKKLLVFPQSFNLGDGNNRVLSYSIASNRIYTNNMLGIVGRNGSNIRIHSRFDDSDSDFFVHYMLMRIAGINLFNLPTGYSPSKDIYDLLMFLFPAFLNNALSNGLMKMYVERQYNDGHVKGSIDIPRHIRNNKPSNGKVAYTVREYSYDNPMTELIRHCIEYIKQTSIGRKLLDSNMEIRNNVRIITEMTPKFNKGERLKVIQKNRKTIIHPLYKRYIKLQKLCMAILQHKKVSYDYNEKQLHGIIVDGAWLWEEYMAIVLKNHMKHCTRQTKRYSLFTDGSQRIIPDYLSVNENSNIVGDAKYIPLDKFVNGEITEEARAEAIYYKTIMYMLRFNCKIGYLFYPLRDDKDGKEVIDKEVEEYGVSPKRHLYIMGLRVSAESNDFKTFCKEMELRENELLSAL